MLILFHCLAKFFYERYKRYIERRTIGTFFASWKDANFPIAQRDEKDDIKFDPPVSKQRYERVSEILIEDKWRSLIHKIVDFGCGNFALFPFVKHLHGINEIVFIDADDLLLRDVLFKIYPLNADHLTTRPSKLNVKAFSGSVADPDLILNGTDAVIAIELIEHLYPDVLEAVPYNIFAFIRPKLAVITTPNADFNVLFPKLKCGKFRHADHKFEWTREQFESWAANITVRFPEYMVFFDGVGLGPQDTESFGSCSQVAVFVRKEIICDSHLAVPCTRLASSSKDYNQVQCLREESPRYSFGICTYESRSGNCSPHSCINERGEPSSHYDLLASLDYPYNVDERTEEQKIVDEIKYRINRYTYSHSRYYNSDADRYEIPLDVLTEGKCGHFITKMELRRLLAEHNYKIEECQFNETDPPQPCVIYEMENKSDSTSDKASGYESYDNEDNEEARNLPILKETDWDEDLEESNADKVTATPDEDWGSKDAKQAALFDSGYQRSPLMDDSPKTFMEGFQEAAKPLMTPVEPTKPNRFSNKFSVSDTFVMDKVNELDAFRKERKNFNFSSNIPHKEAMKKICEEIARHPQAGPSNVPDESNPGRKTPDEPKVVDAKSIANCIIENTLNKIDDDEPHQLPNIIQEILDLDIVEPPIEIQEPVQFMIVENGDLANNNRDREGNNYQAEIIRVVGDLNVDNENQNAHNNNQVDMVAILIEDVQDVPQQEEFEEHLPPQVEVAWSSREALVDSNSHVDLLDDFDMGAAAQADGVDLSNCLAAAGSVAMAEEAAAFLPEDDLMTFPNWLLEIFQEDLGDEELDLHDEPHFYCQGDGLGVHPSIIDFNDNDDEDADDEGHDTSSSSSDSSTSGSVDLPTVGEIPISAPSAEVPTEPHDIALAIVGQAIETQNHVMRVPSEQGEEFFETAEDVDVNAVTGSCNLSNNDI